MLLDLPKYILNVKCTLKRVTLRFGNTPDMIKIPLRSMVNYAAWSQHKLSPMFSRQHRWTIKRLHTYSLCHTIPDSSKVRSPVSPYHVSTLLPTNPVYSSCVIFHPSEQVTCWPAISMKTYRVGPEYLSSHGQTNPTIDQSHQPTPFKHPRWYTFMIALLRRDGWCSQSTLPVVVIKKRSHGH